MLEKIESVTKWTTNHYIIFISKGRLARVDLGVGGGRYDDGVWVQLNPQS